MLGETLIERSIGGTSIEKTRNELVQNVWITTQNKQALLTDDMLINCIKRREDIQYLRTFILSGGLQQHDRINSVEKLATFLADIHGPSLKDVMSMDLGMLSKLNYNLASIPLTENERQIKQMEDFFYKQAIFKEVEEQQEEEGEGGESNLQEIDARGVGVEGVRVGLGVSDFVWPCIFPQVFKTPHLYTWYRAVWYRVNLPFLYVSREKAMAYARAHLPQIQYLDSLADPQDGFIDKTRMVYSPIRGAATMNENIDYFKREVVWHKVKKTPSEYLSEVFPHKKWTVEDILSDKKCIKQHLLDPHWNPYLDNEGWAPIAAERVPFHSHTLYRAMVFLANQCNPNHSDYEDLPTRFDNDKVEKIKDVLWVYYCCFVDFFWYVGVNTSESVSDESLLTPVGSTIGRKGDMNYSGKLSPWEMYATHLDVRARHAGDLPDIFHLLNSIPLGGEQCSPTTRLGKIYQKCLPFACQRRLIIDLIVETIHSDDAFWNLCSQLFWVMLAGLYPGDNREALTMRDLMRAKELSENKELFLSMLNPPPPYLFANGGPLVVFTAFRLHIIYMASFNPTYVECARGCIDWDSFVQNTRDSAQIIRESDLLPEDAFERARTKMVKTIKNSNSRVSRIRRRSLPVTLTKETNEVLEKLIFKDYYEKRSGVFSFPPSERGEKNNFYPQILSISCKSNITNLLLRIPPQDRFTYNAYKTLTLPEYGGVSIETVDLMNALTTVYFTSKGMPKDFARVIDQFGVRDFIVVCYYFNMATELERISFVTLDAETVRRTDKAMVSKSRFNLYPTQEIPEDAFKIRIALCCGRICTLMGQGKFGSKAVAYDMEKQCYVCSKGKLLHKKNKLGADEQQQQQQKEDEDLDFEDDEEQNVHNNEGIDFEDDERELDEEEEEDFAEAQNDHIEPVENILLGGLAFLVSDAVKQNGRGTKRSKEMDDRKAIRTERKRFNRIPCGQPVLTIDLRGRALVWGNTGEKQKQYMFCPQCAALHVYSIFNFSGAVDGLYRCNECAAKEVGHKEHIHCAYCRREPFNTLDIITLAEPNQGGVERFHFCKNHYTIAKKWYMRCTTKEMLWAIIAKIEYKRRMKK